MSGKTPSPLLGPARVAVIVSLAGLWGCQGLTVAEQGARYFNLEDGATFRYETDSGLAEVHEYARDDEEEERQIFHRTARRGGFLQDDATMTFEVTEDRQLLITEYFDCVTRCGELSEDVVLFPSWPLEGGEDAETMTLVRFSENGEADGERTETHRVAIGDPESVEVPAGTFEEAHRVVWTRTVDEESESATLVFAPEAGFVSFESFEGFAFDLVEGPIEDEEDAEGG